MYHIFAPKCHGQDSARLGEYHPLLLSSAYAPGLIKALAPILARIGSMKEHLHLARTRGGLDAFGAVDEVSRARLHAEAIERVLSQSGFGPLAEVGGDGDRLCLERALERGPQLALGVGGIELFAIDTDPGTASRCLCADVRCHGSVRPERQPDEILARALAAREDTGALRPVRLVTVSLSG
jgi:hypothetical protein